MSETNGEDPPVTRIETPVKLHYTIIAGKTRAAFLRGITEGRLLGGRCPSCKKVYLPPAGACPTCSCPSDETVEVAPTGVVTTFCVVNIPFEGQRLTPPYVAAAVLLDGADLPLFHLVGGVDPGEVRMGMRVRAAWVDPDEMAPTLESIRYFAPTGEDDAPYDSFKEHL